MAGMLTQAQDQPSSGPPQTPPVGSPGAGTPLPNSAAGPEQPAAGTEELRDRAIQKLYGENLEQMFDMFEANGPDKFARSMSVAVNGALEFLENEPGGITHEQAAEVGMDLMMKLLEDVIGEGVMPDVTLEQVQQTIPAIMVMYADRHPDVTKEDVQAVVSEAQRGVAEQEGASPEPETPPEPLSTGPGPEPSGSPVPPGVV